MQIKFLNKILDTVKKENETNPKITSEEMNNNAGKKMQPGLQSSSGNISALHSKTGTEDDVNDLNEINSNQAVRNQSERYDSDSGMTEALKKNAMDRKLPEDTTYFSQKRRILEEEKRKARRRSQKKENSIPNMNENLSEKNNSQRFILRESKLTKKIPFVTTLSEKEGARFRNKKNQNIHSVPAKATKTTRQPVDRDSTLFAISTLSRLVSQEKLINEEAESIFEVAGKRRLKLRKPLTRKKVEALKAQKFGTRHPLPGKKIEIHPADSEKYNLTETVEKAEAIYKNYHDLWE